MENIQVNVKKKGYFWIRPFCDKKYLPLKSNHYNGRTIKANDKKGNPIFIGAIVVWKIRDTSKAIYGVNNYVSFVPNHVSIKFIYCKYPYEVDDVEPSLKNDNEKINQLLKLELERRIKITGIEIEDAKITEISYGR